MAKLYFRYGAMNSGKSTALLQVAHNYEERGMQVLLMKPSVDLKSDDMVVSRLGISRRVDRLIAKDDDIRELFLSMRGKERYACVLIDEAQFLEPVQIDQLFELAVKDEVPVICYGIRTDFKMDGFPGSERLLLIAHAIEELKTICRCGKKAMVNARKIDGKFVFEGSQIAIDEIGNVSYESLCPTCYFQKRAERPLSDCLKEAITDLQSCSDTPSMDAKLLMKKVLHFTDSEFILRKDYLLSEEEYLSYRAYIERRMAKEPVAYLIGSKGFMDYEFEVGSGVLIPRPETELLVEKVLERIDQNGDGRMRGLEIGVGSGCISISLLKMCRNLRMRASDISSEALSYAERNARHYEVLNRLDLICADLVDDENESYDFIVSNPPYISEKDYGELMADVKDYEPKLALLGGRDGLDYYRRILEKSKRLLKKGGFLAFEIGYDQAEALNRLFLEHAFRNLALFQDLSGRDRVLIGEKHD